MQALLTKPVLKPDTDSMLVSGYGFYLDQVPVEVEEVGGQAFRETSGARGIVVGFERFLGEAIVCCSSD